MTETPEERAARLLARSLAIDPPWEGTPACWAWPAAAPALPLLPPATLAALQQAEGWRETLLLEQWHAGRCAVCGRHEGGDLVVDHDHRTGLVRGLLCRSCNTREGNDQRPVGILGRYRQRPPAEVLGLTLHYVDPYTGERAAPAGDDDGDRWEHSPVTGL